MNKQTSCFVLWSNIAEILCNPSSSGSCQPQPTEEPRAITSNTSVKPCLLQHTFLHLLLLQECFHHYVIKRKIGRVSDSRKCRKVVKFFTRFQKSNLFLFFVERPIPYPFRKRGLTLSVTFENTLGAEFHKMLKQLHLYTLKTYVNKYGRTLKTYSRCQDLITFHSLVPCFEVKWY